MKHLIVFLCCILPAISARVSQTLRFTWEEGAPNGQSRHLIYTNGQFPGPPLILDEDDEVEITVINDLPRNTTVHWHGLTQPGTPWSDGVIGLTQQPILPGESFIYRFTATPPGTHWYHSHERMSLVDGLYGAIFIKPKHAQTDLWAQISPDPLEIQAMAHAAANPQLIVVSDWSQYVSEEYWKANEESGLLVFCVDSILVNGVGAVFCPPLDFLDNQTEPNVRRTAFGPDDHVTDKGCLPFLVPIEGGPWNYTYHPEKIPPRMQEGCVPSPGQNASIQVDPADGWVSLNFVAAATTVQFVVSLDEHELWLYEMNGHYVRPRPFVAAVMSAGETFSVLVKLDQPAGRYTLRIPDSGGTQVISAFAEIVYKGADDEDSSSSPWLSYGGLALSEEIHSRTFAPWGGDDGMTPWPSVGPYAGPADEEYLLVMGRVDSAYNYTMRTHYLYPPSFQADSPLLFNPNATVGTEDEHLVIRTKNGSWVDLILEVSTLPGDQAAFMHFMHKHGSRTWRIGQGQGRWNYSSVEEARAERPQDFNLVNPGYRDTWLTQFSPGGGYWSVLRYQVDNPGPWLFHCHVELHLMGGMALAILDGVDVWPQVPPEYRLGGNGYHSEQNWGSRVSLQLWGYAKQWLLFWG
ncbi:hypothetical protein ASPZODRAFT_2123349 [Penicilliopsis zonata CBS 506.65]|uniref:Uncharacterized protein n=1 Tax=Penicilliopsis zonata CBS 506.65 TaxID=1073090 RepID=A0A1L9SMB4_9EURO|nr:hypothetical protein ASPZODRAFT_2123349 [Penicilliopsis zonata CBS 506.65]OJJ48194.1 hypothetical protein ASPZODRAFT_2123349 [Penicilliopsis zonata CBS 506.65]